MYRSRNQVYLVPCAVCGRNTSKQYARAHDGACKACATGAPPLPKQRSGYCEDAPCCGCCGPQGDNPDHWY